MIFAQFRKSNSVQKVIWSVGGFVTLCLLAASVIGLFFNFNWVTILWLMIPIVAGIIFYYIGLKFRSDGLIPLDKGNAGTGWIILLLFFMYPTKENTGGFEQLGLYRGVSQITGATLSIIFYFYLRQKLLFEKIKKVWHRSFISGAISYVIVYIFVLIVAKIAVGIMDKYNADAIKNEGEKLQFYAKQFTKQDSLRWKEYTAEPQSVEEVEINIAIIEKALPYYREKDSTVFEMYMKIISILMKSTTASPDLVNQVDSLNKKSAEIRNIGTTILTNLLNYQKAILNSDPEIDRYYSIYTESVERGELLQKKISEIGSTMNDK